MADRELTNIERHCARNGRSIYERVTFADLKQLEIDGGLAIEPPETEESDADDELEERAAATPTTAPVPGTPATPAPAPAPARPAAKRSGSSRRRR